MSRIGRWVALAALAAPLPACEELPAAPDTNQPPAAAFAYTPVAPIYAGQTSVEFNAIGSRDPDGTIASYEWSFGDGSPDVTSPEPAVRHTFRDTGARCLEITYGVLLVVEDDKGQSGVASQNVTVTQPPAPTAPECR